MQKPTHLPTQLLHARANKNAHLTTVIPALHPNTFSFSVTFSAMEFVCKSWQERKRWLQALRTESIDARVSSTPQILDSIPLGEIEKIQSLDEVRLPARSPSQSRRPSWSADTVEGAFHLPSQPQLRQPSFAKAVSIKINAVVGGASSSDLLDFDHPPGFSDRAFENFVPPRKGRAFAVSTEKNGFNSGKVHYRTKRLFR